MGSIRTFNPVKLFVGVLASNAGRLPTIEDRLMADFGPVDHRSPIIPFRFTDYYKHEMGETIDRVFLSFERLIEADRLPQIKVTTNLMEEAFAAQATDAKRPVNLDPGYLEHAKIVLASTKNFYHRMYLADGIFGEVTMHYKNNAFLFFPWTYPDYQSAEYQEFFLTVRRIYREQLRSMCLLARTNE